MTYRTLLSTTRRTLILIVRCIAVIPTLHVDGAAIFPKLPVYLKQHFTEWQRNQRIKDTLRASQPEIDALLASFATSIASVRTQTASAEEPAPAPVPANTPAATPVPAVEPEAAPAPAYHGTPIFYRHPVLQHGPLPQAPAEMVAAREGTANIVAGMVIGVSAATQSRYVPNRKRGPDRKAPGQKRVRTCTMCQDTIDCPGRFGGWKCREFGDASDRE